MITQNNIVYAGFWKRVAAFLIDNLLITLVSSVAAGLIFRFAGSDTNQIFFIKDVIYFAALILYWPVMESSSVQASLGKIAVGIKVTDLGNKRLSFGRALLRSLCKLASVVSFLFGFFMAGWTKKKQALHDMMAKCLVVEKSEQGASPMMPIYTTGSVVLAAVLFIVLLSYFYVKYFAEPLVPALRSAWIHVHVPLGLAAYSAALASFMVSVLSITRHKAIPQSAVRLQLIAMIAFVLCVLSGSIWAAAAWGHYWNWDPKETWSLLLAVNVMLPTLFVLKYAQFNWLKLSMLSVQIAMIILVAMMDRIFPGLHSYRMIF